MTPVYEELYESVRSGEEARIVIETCGKDDYRERLEAELDALGSEEIWRTGKQVRQLRPESKTERPVKETTGAAAAKEAHATK